MCDREFKSIRGLAVHITKKHKASIEYYYNTYLSDGVSGCLTCGKPTKFHEITTGYAKFCSMKCNNTNPELSKQRRTKRSATLIADPSIMKKSGIKISQVFKSNPDIKINAIKKFKETLNSNPHIIEQSKKKRKETLASNPEIEINRAKKTSKTHRENPNIMKVSLEKRAKTLKENPEIQINAIKKFKETCRKDPSIIENRSEKFKAMLAEDPSMQAMISKASSIGLREYYSKLKQNSSTAACSVYLMSSESTDIIKIGITSNLGRRLSSIRKDFGPTEIVKVVETTYDNALALEIKMHKRFKDHCEVQPKGGGRTEWFSKRIEASALKMLEEFESSNQV